MTPFPEGGPVSGAEGRAYPVGPGVTSDLLDPAADLSVVRAVVAGHALVSGGVVAIVVATMAVGMAVTNLPPVLLAALGSLLGWPWWSATVPRWWRWALRRGVDPYQLQEGAEAAQLVWPRDSLLARTEFGDRWAGIDRPARGPVVDLRAELLASARPRSAADVDGPLWGVVSEFGYAGGSATLIAFDDGSCSMYTSDGGGVIEAGAHDAVRSAADRLMTVADRVASALPATTDTRLPEPGEGNVFLLFADRLLGVRAPLSDRTDDDSPTGELRAASRDLLAAVRSLAGSQRP